MSRGKSEKGVILIGVSLALLTAMVMVPFLVQRGAQESRWGLKEQNSATAFNMAETAADRGLWKLKSSTTTWAQAKAGTAIAGYEFDITHLDPSGSGSTYRIDFSSGPGANEVTVLGEGRDAKAKETRAIQIVYQSTATPSSSGGYVVGGLAWLDPSKDYIHWTEISAMDMSSGGSGCGNRRFWPMRRSAGDIMHRNTSGCAGSPAPPPNTDGVNCNLADAAYCAQDSSVQPPPVIDFDYYKTKAQSTSLVKGTTTATYNYFFEGVSSSSDPRPSAYKDTGYFPTTHVVRFDNVVVNSTNVVIFVETANFKIQGNAFLRVQALVNKNGNTKIAGMGTNSLSPSSNTYTVPVPPGASAQYQTSIVYPSASTAFIINTKSPDTSASDEYPGDGGLGT
jgi:hypothetical protein